MQAVFKISPRTRGNEHRRHICASLRGIIKCGGCDSGMLPTSTRKQGRLYRYYTPNAYKKESCLDCPVGSISAGEIEGLVVDQLKTLFIKPDVVAETWQQAVKENPALTMHDVRRLLENILENWDDLFPAQAGSRHARSLARHRRAAGRHGHSSA